MSSNAAFFLHSANRQALRVTRKTGKHDPLDMVQMLQQQRRFIYTRIHWVKFFVKYQRS